MFFRDARSACALLPVVAAVKGYRIEWLRNDLAAGLSVAAVAVPVAIAYAQLNASLIFYNAPQFKQRVIAVADANPHVTSLIVDSTPIAHLDSTGADTIADLVDDLARRNIKLRFGGVLPQVRQMLERSGALDRLGPDAVFETVRAAVAAHESRMMRQ